MNDNLPSTLPELENIMSLLSRKDRTIIMARVLHKIKNMGGWDADGVSFVEYVEKRFGIRKTYAYRLVATGDFVKKLDAHNATRKDV